MPRNCLSRLFIVNLVLIPATVAHPHGSIPNSAPVGRLVVNLKKYTQEHPDDADGHYALARVHSLAFCVPGRRLSYFPNRGAGPIEVCDYNWESLFNRGQSVVIQPSLTDAELADHLAEAITGFERAISLKDDEPRYYLTYAYTLEIGAPLAAQVRRLPPNLAMRPTASQPASQPMATPPVLDAKIDELDANSKNHDTAEAAIRSDISKYSEALHRRRNDPNASIRAAVSKLLIHAWREESIKTYRRAFELTCDLDHKNAESGRLTDLDRPISLEAASSLIRLMNAREKRTPADEAEIRSCEKHLIHLREHMGWAITPIIFAFSESASAVDLLDDSRVVKFDLDGDGVIESWPWVRPDTAFLVWDPDRTGEIRSGLQLFGSATWWVLFRDGYQAMNALDDNRDGRLSGSELVGLAIWFDRNTNGVSDPREVVPIEQTLVDSLSVHSTTRSERSIDNPNGLSLKTGRVLPTYDWITAPAVEPKPARESTVIVSQAR